MKTKLLRLLLSLLLISVCVLPSATATAADILYRDVNRDIERRFDYLNTKTGNRVCLIDEDKLIKNSAALLEVMKPLSDDGTVIFWSCSETGEKQDKQIDTWQDGEFAKDSVILVINLERGYLNLYTSGAVYRAIPKDELQRINDAIIDYASAGEYDTCAVEGFTQVYKKLHPDAPAPTTPPVETRAAGEAVRYTNPETGCQVMILDDCDLLTDTEEERLAVDMQPVTTYGHIIFWSTDVGTSDSEAQAREKRASYYGTQSAGILSINMKTRKVVFHSDGLINQYVSASYARSVTDNASGYASSGDYYRCAQEVYDEVFRLLNGQSIAEPMKYTSYVVIALMLAFVIVVGLAFGVFNPLRRRNKQPVKLLANGRLIAEEPVVRVTGTRERAWITVTSHILLFLLRCIVEGIFSGGGGSGGGSSSGGSSGGGGGSSGGGSGGSSSF